MIHLYTTILEVIPQIVTLGTHTHHTKLSLILTQCQIEGTPVIQYACIYSVMYTMRPSAFDSFIAIAHLQQLFSFPLSVCKNNTSCCFQPPLRNILILLCKLNTYKSERGYATCKITCSPTWWKYACSLQIIQLAGIKN